MCHTNFVATLDREIICIISRNFIFNCTLTKIGADKILGISLNMWHYCSNFSKIFGIDRFWLVLYGIAQNFMYSGLTTLLEISVKVSPRA